MSPGLVGQPKLKCSKTRADSIGYISSAAVGLRDALLFKGAPVQIHSRVLGNVIYLMASLTSKKSDLSLVEEAFMQKLDAMNQRIVHKEY